MPVYVIDPENMSGRGPFASTDEATSDISDNGTSPEAIVVVIDENGMISEVLDVTDINDLEEVEA